MTLNRLALGLVVSVGLVACASSNMKRFIGRDARDVVVRDGPPVNVFDLPDGERAFQYAAGGGKRVKPKTTATNGQSQLVGDSAYYSESRLEATGNTLPTASCYITYLARWNSEKEGWVVTDIAYPKQSAC